MGNKNEFLDSKRRKVVEKFLEQLETHNGIFVNGYVPKRIFNPISDHFYNGINVINLQWKAVETNDPRFMTIVQANKKGYRIRKGAKSELVFYVDKNHKEITKEQYEKLVNDEKAKDFVYFDEEKNTYFRINNITTVSNVFNGAYVDGLEEYDYKQDTFMPTDEDLQMLIDIVIDNAFVEVQMSPYLNVAPHYARSKDNFDSDGVNEVIRINDNFVSTELKFSTLIHELAHATGAKGRLNRLKDGAVFGDDDYAREELIVAFTDVFVCTELGIPYVNDNHLAYVKSWINHFKDGDKDNELVGAIFAGERAAKYLYENVLSKSLEQWEEWKIEQIKKINDETMVKENVEIKKKDLGRSR